MSFSPLIRNPVQIPGRIHQCGLGIYNAATFVSANNTLCKTIRKHASESRLLDLIGHAEMDREIQKTVTKIVQSQSDMKTETKVGIELDEKELKRYIDLVIRELKRGDENTQ
jgi:hypothetical protein